MKYFKIFLVLTYISFLLINFVIMEVEKSEDCSRETAEESLHCGKELKKIQTVETLRKFLLPYFDFAVNRSFDTSFGFGIRG